ncbi:hypothetical protein DRW03_04090 [Corallococcus sp. H22C18031201]|nr:hypothetical protein DRW03_04090 [Corallococcus sp. H22C18031201]
MKRNVGNQEWVFRALVGLAPATCAVMTPLPLAVRRGAFYGGGTRPSLLAALVTGRARKVFQPELPQSFRRWMQALSSLLTETGVSAVTARELFADLVIAVQGAFIVSRGTDGPDLFSDTLRRQHARLKSALDAARRCPALPISEGASGFRRWPVGQGRTRASRADDTIPTFGR